MLTLDLKEICIASLPNIFVFTINCGTSGSIHLGYFGAYPVFIFFRAQCYSSFSNYYLYLLSVVTHRSPLLQRLGAALRPLNSLHQSAGRGVSGSKQAEVNAFSPFHNFWQAHICCLAENHVLSPFSFSLAIRSLSRLIHSALPHAAWLPPHRSFIISSTTGHCSLSFLLFSQISLCPFSSLLRLFLTQDPDPNILTKPHTASSASIVPCRHFLLLHFTGTSRSQKTSLSSCFQQNREP